MRSLAVFLFEGRFKAAGLCSLVRLISDDDLVRSSWTRYLSSCPRGTESAVEERAVHDCGEAGSPK